MQQKQNAAKQKCSKAKMQQSQMQHSKMQQSKMQHSKMQQSKIQQSKMQRIILSIHWLYNVIGKRTRSQKTKPYFKLSIFKFKTQPFTKILWR